MKEGIGQQHTPASFADGDRTDTDIADVASVLS
jgi:hypothetical protein